MTVTKYCFYFANVPNGNIKSNSDESWNLALDHIVQISSLVTTFISLCVLPPQLLVELETSAIALTCVQAAVDPLIYTLVTRQFRSELSKIFPSIPSCPMKSTS